MKYRAYMPTGEMVPCDASDDKNIGYGYVRLEDMLDAEMEIAKLEDERQDWEDQSVLVELQRALIAKLEEEIDKRIELCNYKDDEIRFHLAVIESLKHGE